MIISSFIFYNIGHYAGQLENSGYSAYLSEIRTVWSPATKKHVVKIIAKDKKYRVWVWDKNTQIDYLNGKYH